MKKLRIAQIAPLAERVPPKKYGGTERVVYTLTEGLVKKGHQVTLFASGDSKTNAKLISVYPRNLREAGIEDVYGTNNHNLLNFGLAYSKSDEFDLIHDHLAPLSLPTANNFKGKSIMTMHGAFDVSNQSVFATLNNPHIVTISHSQYLLAPRQIHHIGTVYNGLNMDYYPFGEKANNYLLFMGRISKEKGAHHAIEVAQYLNIPLILAGKVDQYDKAYFEQTIAPKLSNRIKWIGEVAEKERNRLYAKALCLLHPVTWPEPFGLAMIEAMACGCPVIAFNLGSIPEIVAHSKTGFVVSTTLEMSKAVKNIKQINRLECRKYSLENFSGERMVDNYEKIYYQIVNQNNVKKLSDSLASPLILTGNQQIN